MTAILGLALLLQAAAIVLLRCRLGRPWLRHPVTLLVLTSVMYQGVAPLLALIPSVAAWDTYRDGIAQSFTNLAALLEVASMLALTIGYLLTCPERAALQPGRHDAGTAARVLDWRLLTLGCVPLAILTYQGHGFGTLAVTGAGAGIGTSVASTFFITLVTLAAFTFLARHGSRWFLPVLIAQSLFLAAAGERSPVVVAAITLFMLMDRTGMRPDGRQVAATAVLTLALVMAITGVRGEMGRSFYQQDRGIGARVTVLSSGLTAPPAPGSPGLVAQAATRFDGTSFTAAILQVHHLGQSRLSAAYVPESLLIAVPSAVWPSKLSEGSALNPAQMETDDFGLQQMNFLPGLPGLYAGFLSPPWLVALMAFLGVLAGWGERWLLRRCTPARLVMLAGAVMTALWFEKGLPGMLLALRAAVVLALVVKVMEAVAARRHAPDQVTITPGLRAG